MGVISSIYRDGLGDSTNGGVSSVAKGLCLVNVNGPFEPSKDYPAALLVSNNVGDVKSVRVVPAIQDGGGGWIETGLPTMFGGNLVSTSDSRIGEKIASLIGGEFRFWPAVAIHDRVE